MFGIKHFLLVALFSLIACVENNRTTVDVSENVTIKVLEPESFKSLLDQQDSPQLIDVRTVDEINTGVLPGALHKCFTCPEFEEATSELDKNKAVFVYCRVGGRSARAAAILRRQGFKEIYDLSGGILAWQKAGYELSTYVEIDQPQSD